MIIFNTLLAILFIGYIGNYYYKNCNRFRKPIIFELKNEDENTDYTKIRYSKKKSSIVYRYYCDWKWNKWFNNSIITRKKWS